MIRRTIVACLIVFILSIAYGLSGLAPSTAADQRFDGQAIFRFDTFGDEQLWTDVLACQAIATVDQTARSVGLKVDAELAYRNSCSDKGWAGGSDKSGDDDRVIRLNAVVGSPTGVDSEGTSPVSITCALCHSSVDNSFAPGIGTRLDGWANTDLNVGAIVALSPALDETLRPSCACGAQANTIRGTMRSTNQPH
jgi:hypothetical protein